MLAEVVYGTRTKSYESWFFQDQCPVKVQSVSKLGYFWSVWNIHWKIWDIHKVLAVTFDLEEQLECSVKCFSLVMQELEHWPGVGDIHLPLSTLLNGTNSNLPQLQRNAQWWCLREDEPSISYHSTSWQSLRKFKIYGFKQIEEELTVFPGSWHSHERKSNNMSMSKIKRKKKKEIRIKNARKPFRGQLAQLWMGRNFSVPSMCTWHPFGSTRPGLPNSSFIP